MLDKPKVIFHAEVSRRRYFRRFMWMLLLLVAAFGAWAALDEAAGRGVADSDLLTVGKGMALIVMTIAIVRALLNLYYWQTTHNEEIVVFDRGFVWKRGKKQSKYSWAQLKAFRHGARTLRLFGRPILQRGAHTLAMRDGKTYKFTARHGDTQAFADAVTPIIEDHTGTRMGQALRSKKSVRLHPQLVISAAGVQAGGTKIRWSQVDVQMKNNQLGIYVVQNNGKFKLIRRYPAHEVDNLAGFLDLAHSLIQNHQPKRFNIRTQI